MLVPTFAWERSKTSIIRQIRQRVASFPGFGEVSVDHRIRNTPHLLPMPVGPLILVDEPCAYAFAELRVAAAVEAHGVFHLEYLGQGQVPGAVDLFPDQMSGERATFGQGPGGTTE